MKIFRKTLSAATASLMAASMLAANFNIVGVADAADMNAVQLVEAMGQGWNLGNSLDCSNTWTNPLTPEAIETAWGNPVTTEAMIKEIKKSGFSTVRIPITWQQMISSDGTPKDEWLARIKEVVDYCVKNDMYAIINTHHDEGGSGQSGWINGSGSDTVKKFSNLWTNVANYFKDYDQHLVFEGMNEEDLSNSDMMKLNQAFVDAVRATGGNNTSRLLLVEAQANNTGKALDSSFSVPSDNSNMLAVSVHYYEPSTFCVATTESTWGHRETWGTADDYTILEKDFDQLESKFIKNGVGVIIGEYGVDTSNKGAKDKESMKKFLKEVSTYALGKEGMCPVVWDMSVDNNGEGDMAYFNRNTLSWYDDSIKQIFLDAASGSSADTGKTKTDRITFKKSDIAKADGTLLIDLKPYKNLGVTVNNVLVDYTLSCDGSAESYGAGGAVSFNMVDASGNTHWASSGYNFTTDSNQASVEIPDVITATDDDGNEYTGSLDMDYLKVENWWTWTDPEDSGNVKYEYGDVTVILSDYIYVDDIGTGDEEEQVTTATPDETPETTTTVADETPETTTVAGEEQETYTGVYANAYLAGAIGANNQWNVTDAAEHGTVAQVDGNGTFEAVWDLAEGSETIDFLMLEIESTEEFGSYFTTDTFENLSLTIDHLYFDGQEVELTDTEGAINLRYFEGTGKSRAYFVANWGANKGIDFGISKDTTIAEQVKVVFTIDGTYQESESSGSKIVYGDANEDGNVTISDAVTILQYLANGDKFPMSDKARAQADVDGTPGVSGKDAAVIQQVDARVISAADLPLKAE